VPGSAQSGTGDVTESRYFSPKALTAENGVAWVMPDEFFNVYDKTGPGMTNYRPQSLENGPLKPSCRQQTGQTCR